MIELHVVLVRPLSPLICRELMSIPTQRYMYPALHVLDSLQAFPHGKMGSVGYEEPAKRIHVAGPGLVSVVDR